MKVRVASAALGALTMLGLGMTTAPQAQAAYVAYLYQSGSDVIATGSGSFDLGGLSLVEANPSLEQFHETWRRVPGQRRRLDR